MRTRLTYANVAATLALLIAIVGGGSAIAEPIADTAASVTGKVKQALKIGKQSKKSSKQALRMAKSAKKTADQALAATVDTYSKAASDGRYMLKAGVPLRSLAADDADKLDGLDSTAFARSGQLRGGESRLIDNGNVDCIDEAGPSATVQVGPSGLVAVYAEAIMSAGSTDAGRQLRVQLHEPTAIPGCETIMRHNDVASAQRQTLPGDDAGTTGRGGWIIVSAPEGERTFSLRYGHTGNGMGVFPLVSLPRLLVVPL
jgi:hypothetical protein